MNLNLNAKAIESAVDTYSPERMKALLVWFGAEQQTPETSSGKLNAMLEEVQGMEIQDTYSLLQSLAPEEIVRFSLINEFGKAISEKTCFQRLVRCITEHLRGKAA